MGIHGVPIELGDGPPDETASWVIQWIDCVASGEIEERFVERGSKVRTRLRARLASVPRFTLHYSNAGAIWMRGPRSEIHYEPYGPA